MATRSPQLWSTTKRSEYALGAGLSESTTVLVVEDEKALSFLLRCSMEKNGYQVLVSADGKDALNIIQQHEVDLILLDILLPNMDGYDFCREVRKASDVPIIMLTALNTPEHLVRGLEAGADDYLVKPFSFADLSARTYALLRRVYWTKHRRAVSDSYIQLHEEENQVDVRGETIQLSPTEFRLLRNLMGAAEQAVSHQSLMMDIWGYKPNGKASILHTNIRRLREKIESNPADPQYIITVPGFGYKYTLAAAA